LYPIGAAHLDAGLIPSRPAATMQLMDTPNTPSEPRQTNDLEAKALAWLALKREMQSLHAQIEYVRLLIKLGVHQK
jgi:hypothetical protein